MYKLSISERVNGKWKEVDLGQFSCGEDLCRELESMDGREVVAEWRFRDKKRALACGVEKQAKSYRDKGERVITLSALAEGLRSKGYCEEIVAAERNEVVQAAIKELGGVVSSVEILSESRSERVAMMVVDGGKTEAEAHAYCNTQPELFGTEKE